MKQVPKQKEKSLNSVIKEETHISDSSEKLKYGVPEPLVKHYADHTENEVKLNSTNDQTKEEQSTVNHV